MSSTEQPANPIYSSLADDPVMAELITMYVDEMPERVATLTGQWTQRDRQAVARTAHQMKGAGGSYGFAEISDAARVLEMAAKGDAPEDEIALAVAELVRICQAARSGAPT